MHGQKVSTITTKLKRILPDPDLMLCMKEWSPVTPLYTQGIKKGRVRISAFEKENGDMPGID